mgnify:CR=1 FL=1
MKALQGLKILDMSRLLPGPYCSMMLADFGADVIKVEDPQLGDYCRDFEPQIHGTSMWHLLLNRGKRSLTIDLRQPSGKELFLQLVQQADVVMEGYRPGVLDKLGVGYSAASKLNPRIIYCSITGYGKIGPYIYDAGHDLNYVSLAGITAMSGEKDGKPAIPGVLTSDMSAGMQAAIAILIALRHRDQSGEGQEIDISLHNTALSLLPTAASCLFGDSSIAARGTHWFTGSQPNYNIYQTADNRYMAIGCLENKFWYNMCAAMQRLDLVDNIKQERLFESTIQELQREFATKTAAEWMQIFQGKDTCVTHVLSYAEAAQDPHCLANEMVLEIDDAKYGKHRQIGFPIKLSKTPAAIERHAPERGEHSEQVLLENGFSIEQISKLKELRII